VVQNTAFTEVVEKDICFRSKLQFILKNLQEISDFH